MLSNWELWACASEMIRRHGADAAIHAAMRADKLFEANDDDGAAAWRAITNRIGSLQNAGSAHPN